MADDPPVLEQHHCNAGPNFVRIDRLKQYARATSSHRYDAAADQFGDLCGNLRRAVAGESLAVFSRKEAT
jgi:hypothetical protein